MKFSRREYLKTIAVMGTLAAVKIYTADIKRALALAASGEVRVLWIQGAGCTGCTISLLQTNDPDLVEAITNFRLAIDFHPTIMIPAGEEALTELEGTVQGKKPLDVLIVEGAVPEGNFCMVGERNGEPVPFEKWVRELGEKAKYVVAVGTCATFGGIPSGQPNPTKCRGVQEVLPGKTVINIPGCPPHPDWMLLTLTPVLLGHANWIELDEDNRPKMFFHDYIHDLCQRRQFFENMRIAETFGEDECLWMLGCRGPITKSDCSLRLWNKGTSFCILSNGPCIGCTEKGFPDPPFSPFYQPVGFEELERKKLKGKVEVKPKVEQYRRSELLDTLIKLGVAVGAIGVIGYGASRALRKKEEKEEG